jgi:hypothetical protein
VSVTGIQNTNSLEKYLGFPMIHGRLCKRYFDFLIDKFDQIKDIYFDVLK